MNNNGGALDAPEIQALDTEASALMKRGIGLMGEETQSAAEEALRCFDQALALRQRLPYEQAPPLRYALAACWLNRGEALFRLDRSPTGIDVVLHAYQEAIALLRGLPFHEDVRFPRRLAVALQNRALVLQAKPDTPRASILEALAEAISVLDSQDAAGVEDRDFVRAAIWMNVANARVSEGSAEGIAATREAAERAMELVAPLEDNQADAAEVGLKARHLLCQMLARSLSEGSSDEAALLDLVHQATDLTDEGLDVARHWEQHGVVRFRPIAYDLFRFGIRVYLTYQPHFLPEFVRDNMDPELSSPAYVGSAEMRSAAREAVELTKI